ncbi:hypothetical protein [Enterococcus phage PEF1]
MCYINTAQEKRASFFVTFLQEVARWQEKYLVV